MTTAQFILSTLACTIVILYGSINKYNIFRTHPIHDYRFYYYLPVVAVCVVAFLFPSGRSSGQKKPKTEPAATKSDPSTRNGEIIVTDRKTA